MIAFQYLKGAIQSTARWPRYIGTVGFQYLKGAIQSRRQARRHYPVDDFQYLKGAIQSFPQVSVQWLDTFQYLKGAIQSPCNSGPKPNVRLAKAVCNRPRASVLSSPYGSAQTPGD